MGLPTPGAIRIRRQRWASGRGPRVQSFPGRDEFRSSPRDRRTVLQRRGGAKIQADSSLPGPSPCLAEQEGERRRGGGETAQGRTAFNSRGWGRGCAASRGLFVNQFPVAGS